MIKFIFLILFYKDILSTKNFFFNALKKKIYGKIDRNRPYYYSKYLFSQINYSKKIE